MRKYFILFLLSFITACSSAPKFTSQSDSVYIPVSSQSDSVSVTPVKDLSAYINVVPIDTIVGVASYYANKFNGRKTSNGELYDMNGFTAAHPNFPFGTIIRVVNISNDKNIIVRVNDRMPKRSDRIIDLSYRTALELDIIKNGTADVRLEILEWGPELDK